MELTKNAIQLGNYNQVCGVFLFIIQK